LDFSVSGFQDFSILSIVRRPSSGLDFRFLFSACRVGGADGMRGQTCKTPAGWSADLQTAAFPHAG
jgi:hypothetical protein